LILAGAGSGKTSTMSYRIAHLIAERRVPPSAILGLSFTNKAAGELKERVKKLVSGVSGRNATKGITISTFHSLAVKILRAHAERIGFRSDFTILDPSDQRDILRGIFKNVKIDDRKFDLEVILFQIGQAKNRFLGPEAARDYLLESKRLAGDYAIAAATAYDHYQRQLKILNAMDFDDLLFHATRLLQTDAEARAFYNAKFRYVLVDEYQDTNPAQFKLLRLLTERTQNLCVVGDDDQSIYAWRGADPAHILEFARHFPAARVITLDQNYRSTQTILDAANHVIQNNKARHPKSLWSDKGAGEPLTEVVLELDRDEGEFVAEEIHKRALQGALPWKDFAILYRSNAQSRIFEEALRRYQIPYKIVGGLSFLDRKEVKDVLSYWKLILNPQDDASLRRIINWPARGIGKGSIEALSDHAFKRSIPLFEALKDAKDIAPRAATGCAALRELILSLRAELEAIPLSPLEAASWARRSLERIGAKKGIEEDLDDPAQLDRKWENVEELVHSLGQLSPEDLELEEEKADGTLLLREFLARMALDAQNEQDEQKDNAKDDNANQVTLLTLHGAKGLEYPIVFLVGWEEGFLPHRRTLDEGTDLGEERRLAYVGITRAKTHLVLTRTKNRVRYGKPVPRYRSRFLDEIPRELLVIRDESYPDPQNEDEKQKHEEKVKDFLSQIRARLLQPQK
jgi:superfamily I DNA/RNA helicase